MSETAIRQFCGNCGKELQPGDRYCRSCGAASSDGGAEAPTIVERWPASQQIVANAPPPAVAAPPPGGRPGWLIPAAAGAALLVALIVATAIVFASGGDEELVFSEQMAPVLDPVATASAMLGGELSDAEKPSDLAAVGDAADELAQAVSTASGAASVLQVDEADTQRLAQVRTALTATGDYAGRVGAAADSLSAARAKAAETAGATARNGWGAVAAQTLGLAVPSEQSFTAAEQLATLAEGQRQQEAQLTSGKAIARSYVEKIDRC